MLRQWLPCLLILPMLLMWHHIIIQWSSGTAPVLLTVCYPTPVVTWWSTASIPDLRERFFTLHSFLLFQCFLGAASLISKLAKLHAHLQDIALARLILKRFICGRFYFRFKAGWSRKIKFYRALVLPKFYFWNILLLRIWTLFATGKHVTSLLS